MGALATTAELRKSRGRWQWGPAAKESGRMTIPALLWTLYEMGGVIEDAQGGRCGTRLLQAAIERGYTVHPLHHPGRSTGTVSTLLRELEVGRYAGCISRDVRAGKRTYKIELLLTEAEMPPKPFPVKVTKVEPTRPKLVPVPRPVKPQSVFVQPVPDIVDEDGLGNGGPDPDHVPPVPPETPEAPVEAPPVTQPELPDAPETPDVEDVVVSTVPPLLTVAGDDDAFALLIEASTTITRAMLAINAMPRGVLGGGPTDVDIDEAAKRMADTLAENARLRRKLNEVNETVLAKTKECEGLRKALVVANGNLKAIQSNADQAGQRERALGRFRDVERTMQAPPSARR